MNKKTIYEKSILLGANHPKQSIYLLIVLHVLLQILAVFSGILMYFNDWGTSKWLFLSAIVIYLVSSLLYPIKDSKYTLFAHSYAKQKTFDFVTVAAYLLVLTLGVNNFFTQSPDSLTQQQKLNAPTSLLISYTPNAKILSPKSKRAETRAERKSVRKQIKTQVKELKKEWKKKRKGGGAGQVALILLVVLLAIVLLYLVAGISCSLSCSGQGGLAVFVLVVGGVGVIVLAVLAIRRIIRKNGKRPPRDKSSL